MDLSAAAHLSAAHLDPVLRAIRLAAEIRVANNKPSLERLAELLDEAHVSRLREQVLADAPVSGRTEHFGEAPSPAAAAAREHNVDVGGR